MHGLNDPAVVTALVVAVGVLAQWASARVQLPAILPLLLIGFLVGPVLGWFNPDEVYGDLLFPAVSIAVAIILFEGALSLRVADLRGAEVVVTRLVTLGIAITIAILAAAAHLLLDFSWSLALLFGAIASVSGPTVIIPMLRAVRPTPRLSQALRWEGILIDPIGAVAAVIVFETIIAGVDITRRETILVLLEILAAGIVIGGVLGWAWGLALKRYLVPDFLRNVATLGVVLMAFVTSNLLAPEAGLVAVTVMGLVLANLRAVPTDQIIDFKESLSVLLISVLFIVLAARVDMGAIEQYWQVILLGLGIALFVARPVSALVCSIGSELSWRERVLLGWIAPRGIVAAAISALFAFRLEQEGIVNAELLVPMVFSLIVGTVVIQSLTARPLAKLLGVAEPESRGVLVVGANPVALAIGEALHENGVRVVVADTSWEQITNARMRGLNTFFGNPVSEYADRRLDLVGLGKLMALSRQPALNALACVRYRTEFGSDSVYTVRQDREGLDKAGEPAAFGVRGHLLFKPDMTLENLGDALAQQREIRVTALTEEFSFDDLIEEIGSTDPMLFAISPAGVVKPFSEEVGFRAAEGWRIGYLSKPVDAEQKAREKKQREEESRNGKAESEQPGEADRDDGTQEKGRDD